MEHETKKKRLEHETRKKKKRLSPFDWWEMGGEWYPAMPGKDVSLCYHRLEGSDGPHDMHPVGVGINVNRDCLNAISRLAAAGEYPTE